MTLQAEMTPTEARSTRFIVHPYAAHRTVGGEVFVVTADRAFHRMAAATAVELFAMLNGSGATRDELVARLVARYRVDAGQAGADVDAFLASLIEGQVLVQQD
jgi:hypothetical protein